MAETISRREMLGTSAAAAFAAAGIDWIYARDASGRIVLAQGDSSAWKPVLFTQAQADAVASLCEAIIPRTATPGAREARAHEFIDLQLSWEDAAQQRLFLEGIDALELRCSALHRKNIAACMIEELGQLLEPISDLRESHPPDLKDAANFFGNLKRRTIFAFYTSEHGWVEDLGMPHHPSLTATMEGCHEESA